MLRPIACFAKNLQKIADGLASLDTNVSRDCFAIYNRYLTRNIKPAICFYSLRKREVLTT